MEEAAANADPAYLPWVVDGARRGPPEDCGGPLRYSELLAALEKPLEDLPDDERELVEWAGVDLDPEDSAWSKHVMLYF